MRRVRVSPAWRKSMMGPYAKLSAFEENAAALEPLTASGAASGYPLEWNRGYAGQPLERPGVPPHRMCASLTDVANFAKSPMN